MSEVQYNIGLQYASSTVQYRASMSVVQTMSVLQYCVVCILIPFHLFPLFLSWEDGAHDAYNTHTYTIFDYDLYHDCYALYGSVCMCVVLYEVSSAHAQQTSVGGLCLTVFMQSARVMKQRCIKVLSYNVMRMAGGNGTKNGKNTSSKVSFSQHIQVYISIQIYRK